LVNETTDEICLVEIAARGGGVFTSSDLIPLACGIDVNDLLIKIATGESTEIDKNRYVEAASAYICFYLPEGKIQKISGIDEVISLQCVHKAYLDNIMVGKQINKISDKTMRLGPILIKGENRQAIQETINRIQETLVIEVETSKGVKGIVW
jgi:biotin carboxylase